MHKVDWGTNYGVNLIPKAKDAHPFRIAFAIEYSGQVIPLQQCTDVRFETSHRVDRSRWYQQPKSLVGLWEPTPVSEQLGQLVKKASGIFDRIRLSKLFPFPLRIKM